MKFPWDKDERTTPNEGVDSNTVRSVTEMAYEICSYPDGAKYVKILDFNDLKLTFRINTYDDLWLLSQISDILIHNNLQGELLIPNILDAQADDRFHDNEPFGLKLVCNFINNLKGFNKIYIFHPHNPQVVKTIINRVVILDNTKFINSVLHDISEQWRMNVNPDNLILLSTDAGGFKPLMKLVDKLNWSGETFSASKSRSYVDGRSKLTQQLDKEDFEGKDVLIIDDICVMGGTFKGLSKMLKERNCGKLFLAVSHITIKDLGEDPVTNYFDGVFTTNSKYDTYTSNGEKLNINIKNIDNII